MANREVNILLLRGLAGNYYSTGLDGLALKLRKTVHDDGRTGD